MRTYWSKLLHRAAPVKELWWPPSAFLFLRVLLFIAVSPLLLRVKLPRLLAFLEPRAPSKDSDPVKVDRIIRYTDALLPGRGPFPRRSCYFPSFLAGGRSRAAAAFAVTLYYFLSREGMELGICFGVSPSGESLAGHCWLVRDGEPFLEKGDPLSKFIPMYSFPHHRQPASYG